MDKFCLGVLIVQKKTSQFIMWVFLTILDLHVLVLLKWWQHPIQTWYLVKRIIPWRLPYNNTPKWNKSCHARFLQIIWNLSFLAWCKMAAGTRKKLRIDLKYTNNQLHIISTVLTFINNYICSGDYTNNQLHITTAVLNPSQLIT
jgi:hypothetical protein